MSVVLAVTSKGQITLKRAVLDHMGVRPGQKVKVSLLPGGKVEIAPSATTRSDVMRLRGALHRPGQRTISLEDMDEAIAAGASGE